MATFKATVKRQRKDGYYPVYIRVTHNARIAYIRTDKLVDRKGVTKDNGIKDPFVLQICTNKIARYTEMLNRHEIGKWSVKDIITFLEKGTSDICFSDYARKYHDELYNRGQKRNAKNYDLAIKHLERFAGTDKIMFSQLTSTFINRWIKELSTTARAKEMYPICMRQVFKAALLEYNDYDAGIIRITTNPWPNVKIPKADTPEKKAITLQACRAFFAAPLPESNLKQPLSELARDVAMMVLCLAGINTADIFSLKKKGYSNNIISYNRSKTKNARSDDAYFEIRVPAVLMPVVEKYLDKTDSDYLFNFHQRMVDFDSFNVNVNIGIRQICEKSLNMARGQSYCVYTFRHTWATVAQNDCGATLEEVDFALNHVGKTKLARTYVKVDYSPAWELNEKVVEKIFFTEDESNEHKKQTDSHFGRFSYRHLIKGTLYYKGRILAKIEDVGFDNVNQIIDKLMKELPGDIPDSAMVQIRIENKDNGQSQDYNKVVHKR